MPSTESIFDALPGVEIPVADIPSTLSNMWETPDDAAYLPLSEFRASQMNLVVHFGQRTSAREATEVFATALRFSQRYPSRILLLCPEDRARDEVLLTSKIFSECYIGQSGRDRSCCESILLAYPAEGKDFLENQVSILLETDLPTYYWVHRFHTVEKIADYSFFLNHARRLVYDSGLEPPEIAQQQWPRPGMTRDLAFARLLPIRQSIGQFLSGFPPREIVDGLKELKVLTGEALEAEGRCLLTWMKERLAACASEASQELPIACACESGGPESAALSVRLTYSDDRFFHWQAHKDTRTADFDADFGKGRVHLPASFRFLPPENALGEALFF